MKLLLIVLLVAQVHGALSIGTAMQDQRGFMDIWDLISPIAIPIASGIDQAIGTVTNVHSAVTGAVTGAIHGVTSWIGSMLPALGKRDTSMDARVNLLDELKSFQIGFQQAILDIVRSFISGNPLTSTNIVSHFRQLLVQLASFMQTHLSKINAMISALIPSMQDTVATQAITSSLRAVQEIEQAIRKIQALFSA